MTIHEFLDQAPPKFAAAVVSVDAVGSSGWSGSNADIVATRAALRGLVDDLLRSQRAALLKWEGDGGLWLCDGSRGYADLLVACDKLVSLVPFFNRSQARFNSLGDDVIHLRVVCHAGIFQKVADPQVLSNPAIDDLAHHAKAVGLIDHVVITDNFYTGLAAEDLNRRLSVVSPHSSLGACYVLDKRTAATTIELQEQMRENIHRWLTEVTRQAKYDELDIFAYTNETLYEYLRPLSSNVRVRVLARDWVIEEEEESAQNRRLTLAPGSRLPRTWAKAKRIKSVADDLMDAEAGAGRRFKGGVEIKFYQSSPSLKGAIFRNSDARTRTAYIGLYPWNVSSRNDGGTPFEGDDWAAVRLSDDGGPKTALLDTVQSRFEELWTHSLTYDDMRTKDQERSQVKSSKAVVRGIWQLDGRPYLVVCPARELERRPYLGLAAPDVKTLEAVQRLLAREQAVVETELVLDAEDARFAARLREWDGHLVLLCRRTLTKELLEILERQGFPYRFSDDPESRISIKHTKLPISLLSPIDQSPAQTTDFCIVGKHDRPDGKGKLFIIAGSHAIGTWGGGEYLTQREHLDALFGRVGDDNFAAVIECEIDATAFKLKRVTDRVVAERLPVTTAR